VSIDNRLGATHEFAVRAGERLRLRLVNAASARLFNLTLDGHRMTVIARDGQAVSPYPLETVVIGPGMRVDLVIDCLQKPGSRFALRDTGSRGMGQLTQFAYSADKALRDKPLTTPIKLVANAIAHAWYAGDRYGGWQASQHSRDDGTQRSGLDDELYRPA
jgi:FtsP/CotA-like multicopper oxidase with cupredoxin domain